MFRLYLRDGHCSRDKPRSSDYEARLKVIFFRRRPVSPKCMALLQQACCQVPQCGESGQAIRGRASCTITPVLARGFLAAYVVTPW